jgi:hypothetical protein
MGMRLRFWLGPNGCYEFRTLAALESKAPEIIRPLWRRIEGATAH